MQGLYNLIITDNEYFIIIYIFFINILRGHYLPDINKTALIW